MSGRITTHVLDVSRGVPAAGVKVQLWSLGPGGKAQEASLLSEQITNSSGRLDSPLYEGELYGELELELLFFIGDYFRESQAAGMAGIEHSPGFLDKVPVRFHIRETDVHVHVPLLAAPGGYTTYRGS